MPTPWRYEILESGGYITYFAYFIQNIIILFIYFFIASDAALDVAQPIRLAISTDDILLAVAEDPICKKWLNLE